ncbi:MAG: hypothetical protein ABF649_14090 [Bacillus sp. (in: firmicutes)]
MDLFKWELYKIFNQKIIYIVFTGFMILSTSFIFQQQTAEKKEIYQEWTGPLTSEKIQQAEKENTVLSKEMEELENGEVLAKEVWIKYGIYENIAFGQGIMQRAEQKIAELKNKNTDKAEMETSMLKQIDVSYFSYHDGPMRIIEFTSMFSFVATAAMLLIGLSTSYSNEYSSGIDHYMLSSKKGRKTIVWAKILASMLYTMAVVAIWELWVLFLHSIQYGKEGWDMAMQYNFYLTFSPYPFTFLQYHLIQFGLHLLAALCFALLILFLSMLNKNVLITFFISASVFILPFVIYEMIQWEWLRNIMLFSSLYMMKAEYLFSDLKVINLFGLPVVFPVFVSVVVLLASIVCMIVMFRVMKEREVSN